MKPEDIKQLLNAKPFVPFRLHLSDGSAYDITHPDLVLLSKSAVDVGVSLDPASGIAERIVRCALMHVVKLDPQPA